MDSVVERIRKASTIKEADLVSKSAFFHDKDKIQTAVPALNVALSGQLDGGFVPGFTMWAGPSKHFKTLFTLIMAKAYMDKYPDAAFLFYDGEFGTPISYFESLNFDLDRILHTPLKNIELLKHDIVTQFTGLNRGDKIITAIDSIGNLASNKEIDDAIKGEVKVDMTRAKALKSLFRMATPYLNIVDIPLIAVNHTYKTQEKYAKDVVGGGTGAYYSADNIFIVGRQQIKAKAEKAPASTPAEKEKVAKEAATADILGYDYIIKVEKSRFVREKTKIPITVKFEGGISCWSGLLEMAVKAKLVVKPKVGFYSRVNTETGEVENKAFRAKDTDNAEFWRPIMTDQKFHYWVKNEYQLASGKLLSDIIAESEVEDEELEEVVKPTKKPTKRTKK